MNPGSRWRHRVPSALRHHYETAGSTLVTRRGDFIVRLVRNHTVGVRVRTTDYVLALRFYRVRRDTDSRA